ncbi:MAG TPA: YwiC-like family protein [Thermoanaerobaculia bacterium]|nr:YwiC-like family protein [Thermoanaerobaculia bacterium]
MLRRPAFRPLALPTEHGGWGFLFEPLVLGLAVAPSWGGALIAVAFIFGFLTRQPLKLALQDAMRGKSYPRTRWCWMFAVAYSLAALIALASAIAISGITIVIPIGLVVPLGLTQVLYDANNRSRALLPELAGAAAMSSSAAAIAIAGHMRLLTAFALAGIIAARSLPSIVYVRTLLQRAHGKVAASWPAIALHALAILFVASFAPKLAIVAMVLLFARATWGLARPVPPAKTIGWREIAWGFVTVALAAAGFR